MGSNRETKRRKIKRRKSCNIEIISEIIQPLRTFLPFAKESKPSSCTRHKTDEFDPNMSGECSKFLRIKRHSRSVDATSKRNSSDTSSNGDQKPINLVEAVINSPIKKKSINMYFGTLNRISNGERFAILAKRLTFDGKEQFLLDWDTPNCNGTSPSIKKEL